MEIIQPVGKIDAGAHTVFCRGSTTRDIDPL
jgi:hypothetical protein